MKKILFAIIIVTLYSCNRYYNNKILNIDIKGVIKEKYIDKIRHYEDMVILFRGDKVDLYYWEQADNILYDYIQIGDSIVKRKGEYSLFVYKKNGKVKEFKYMDSNGKVYNNKEKL